jgi:SPP1 gp7 family putative phage head morphogenesis protein
MVQDIFSSLERAIRDGQSLGEWKAQIAEKLPRDWLGSPRQTGRRLETIYRTNVQMAYSAGRYAALTSKAALEARPIWVFDAVMDSRTSDGCRKLQGVMRRHDDPFWDSNYPPRHFRCRSGVRALLKGAGTTENVPDVTTDDGFGFRPDAKEWQPNAAKYSSTLFAEMLRKLPQDIREHLLEPEQIKAGVHTNEITTRLSKKRTRAILRTINAAGIEQYLKKYPLNSIVFAVPDNPIFMAYYDPDARDLLVNVARGKATYGEGFVAGITATVSSAGTTLDEALSRSLLHEIAHHIFYTSFRATDFESKIRLAFKDANFVTRRAGENWQEWLSECFTAYHFENAALKKHDPIGYDIIERLRKELGLP